MGKSNIEYYCEKCEHVSVREFGKCSSCGEYGTCISRAKAPKVVATKAKSGSKHEARISLVQSSASEAIPLTDIRTEDFHRITMGSEELNTVLGGGLTPGSVILLGGAPGAGKSTLMSSVANYLAKDEIVVYASAEEAPQQTKVRMDRMGINNKNILLLPEINLENIIEKSNLLDPVCLIVDSIQLIYTNIIDSSPGSITQVKECANLLTQFAKSTGVTVFIICQMNKDDSFAGPRALEHIVDTTLYLEGDEFGMFRVLRSMKNRFGPAPEIGVFEMTAKGFIDIPNPSEIFLSERNPDAAGTTIAAMLDGTKAMLVEVQALVSDSDFSNPSRNATGFERNRLIQLADILTKHAHCPMAIKSITLNVVGGISGKEPAVDVPMAIAMVSSLYNKVVPGDVVSFGEIGLTGEIRSVSRVDLRIKEAKKIGMKKIIVPGTKRGQFDAEGIEVIYMKNVRELAAWVETLEDEESDFEETKEKKSVKIETSVPKDLISPIIKTYEPGELFTKPDIVTTIVASDIKIAPDIKSESNITASQTIKKSPEVITAIEDKHIVGPIQKEFDQIVDSPMTISQLEKLVIP